jgi:hypothetical protein
MKSLTNIKTVIVNINGEKHHVDVDEDIHDNIFFEAATQVIETHRGDDTYFHKMRLIGECYLKEDEKNPVKHFQFNMYHILNNAGIFSTAALLREKAKNLHDIDIQLQPAIAHAGNPST